MHRHKVAWSTYIGLPMILEACILNMCFGSPKQPSGLVFARRTHRTQHVVVFEAKTNYREKIQSKTSKEKEVHGLQSGATKHKPSGVLSVESCRMCLIPATWHCEHAGEVSSAGKALLS